MPAAFRSRDPLLSLQSIQGRCSNQAELPWHALLAPHSLYHLSSKDIQTRIGRAWNDRRQPRIAPAAAASGRGLISWQRMQASRAAVVDHFEAVGGVDPRIAPNTSAWGYCDLQTCGHESFCYIRFGRSRLWVRQTPKFVAYLVIWCMRTKSFSNCLRFAGIRVLIESFSASPLSFLVFQT